MSADQPVVAQPGRANPQRTILLLGCLPIVAFLAFGLTLGLGYRSDRYTMIALALVTIAVALVPIILDQARPADRRHILLTFYCLLFIGHFGLPIFTQYAVTTMPTDPPGVSFAALFPRDIVAGQWVALVGLISFLIGYSGLSIHLSDRDIEERKARDWPPAAIPVVAAFMLFLGWTVVISGQLGLIPAALGSGVIGTVGSSVVFGNALLTVGALRHKSRIAWIMLAIAVPISTALGFFTGSKRSTLIVPAVVIFTSMLLGGRIRARWIVVGAIVLTLLYPVSEFYRQEVIQGGRYTAVQVLSDPEYTLGVLSDFLGSSRAGLYLSEGLTATAARLDAIGIESVIVRDTGSTTPFQMGRTLILFPAAFVPRLLWPSKPEITIGRWITSTYGTGPWVDSHTGPSNIGDLYLNFGVASVVIGMLVMGALLRLIQTRFLGPHPTTIGILTAIIVIVQVNIKQMGNVSHVLSSTVFAFAPVLIAYFAVPLFFPRKRAHQEPNWSGQGNAEAQS